MNRQQLRRLTRARARAGALLVAASQALVALYGAAPAQAAGEQMGRVRGIVSDAASSARLPGVTVVASGPALIGPPRTVLTDEAGRYEVLDLPPGTYTVEFSYPGTVANVRKVVVRPGQASALNLAYTLQAQAVDVVNLSEARSLTKPDSTATGSSRDAHSLSRTPMSRQYQSAALQVPGTSGGANPNIKGGTSANNRYLIDGIDVTDPVTNTFSMNLTFDSMQSVDVITGGMDAEYNSLGGVVNVITKGGGTDFHAVASAYVNHHRLSSTGNFGTNLWEGEQFLNEGATGKNQRAEASINVGGPVPLLRDKLWYGATYEYVFTESSLVKGAPLGVAPYNIQHPSRTFTGHLARLKLSFAPTRGHRFWFSGNTDPSTISNTAQSNARLGVAESHQKQGGYFLGAGWEWLASDRVIVGAQGAFVYNALEIGPQGRFGKVDFTGCQQFSEANCSYDRNRSQRVNRADNTVWYQGAAYQLDQRRRLQFDPKVTVRADLLGRHTFKAGVQAQYVYRTREVAVPGGSTFTDSTPNNVPLEAGLCNTQTGVGCFRRTDTTPYSARQEGVALGLYVQDSWWTPLQWLTINPGLRGDFGWSQASKGRTIARLFALGPRLGATADLTLDGRNVLFAYYGRNTEPLSLSSASSVDSLEAGRSTVWEWDQANMDYTTKVSESGGPGGTIISTDTKMPHSDEVTGGFRREILPNTVASAEYTYKRISNQWSTLEVNRVWDPSGQRVVGYADSNKEGREVYRYYTPDDPRLYHGVILASEGRPTPRFDYNASYTLSWTTYRATSDNPRQRKFDFGYSSADVRHFLRLYGSYDVLSDLTLGAAFTHQTGTPQTKAFYNVEDADYLNWRSPSGSTPTVPNDPNGVAVFRTPDFTQVDLKLVYNVLPRRTQHRLHLVADVFNVFNTRTPAGVTSTDIARFGLVSSRQAPLRVQLGLTYQY